MRNCLGLLLPEVGLRNNAFPEGVEENSNNGGQLGHVFQDLGDCAPRDEANFIATISLLPIKCFKLPQLFIFPLLLIEFFRQVSPFAPLALNLFMRICA